MPALQAGEPVIWQKLANRQQGTSRAVGGRLCLTKFALYFQPSRFDALFHGLTWKADLRQISKVGIEPRDGNPFSGGIRERLRIDLVDGSTEVFVVNGLNEVLDRLQRMIG